MANSIAEIFGAIFPAAGQVAAGVTFGPAGEQVGTLEADGGSSSSVDGDGSTYVQAASGDPPKMYVSATWFWEYRWTVDDQPVDLDQYDISAKIFYMDDSEFVSLSVGAGIEKDDDVVGQFKLKVEAAQTSLVDFDTHTRFDSMRMMIDIDATRTGTGVDELTGYDSSDNARIVAGDIYVYKRGHGSTFGQ
jgi:hypothetical protein